MNLPDTWRTQCMALVVIAAAVLQVLALIEPVWYEAKATATDSSFRRVYVGNFELCVEESRDRTACYTYRQQLISSPDKSSHTICDGSFKPASIGITVLNLRPMLSSLCGARRWVSLGLQLVSVLLGAVAVVGMFVGLVGAKEGTTRLTGTTVMAVSTGTAIITSVVTWFIWYLGMPHGDLSPGSGVFLVLAAAGLSSAAMNLAITHRNALVKTAM